MSNKSAPTPPRPKAKKLPFKPTALRKPVSQRLTTPSDDTNPDDGLDLFRRSKEMEPIVAADRERKMKKRQRQRQQEEERQKSAESAKRRLADEEDTELDAHPDAQLHKSSRERRRRTPVGRSSIDGDATTGDMVTPPASKRTRLDTTPSKSTSLDMDHGVLALGDSPSARLLRSHTKTATPGSSYRMARTPSTAPIVLVDSDDDDDVVLMAPSPATRRGDDVEDPETSFMITEDDDEFTEYVRKAEEQRARDQAMLNVGPGGEATKDSIEILVTSVVPGTKPCCFKFLFDKQLRIARNTWLTLQHRKGVLKEVEKEDDIVLTWRRQRVYTFSTLLTLGIRPHASGRVRVDGNDVKGLVDGRTRVHMEAWTLDLFHEMEREEEQRRRREAGELSDEEEAPAAVEEEVKIRVILKARGMADVNLTVRPETTVETLITGFRTQRSIASQKDVGLWFDGDRLEEHVTMAEAEIDDMDTFEVHLR
ncbi:hypothetical protein ED733_008058 [Metarhizium rileyi]|uniref:Ubiquitin-like domain-containing protein n=1 Tax=Metarhizium rileyi (strain RCEF 4871) TaxID=1649241 RepID=A0A5C6GLK4_METRR|nr:hypothetical protein ED733_008058 [Metarhizium rileyi]